MIFMSAMMMETTIVGKNIVEMGHAIAKLTKTVEEKDLQIATLGTSLMFKIEGSLAIANLKLISICCEGLIHLLQRRLTTNNEALPSLLLYWSNNCKA